MKVHGIELDPEGDAVCRLWTKNRAFENAAVHRWKLLSRRNSVMVDVGAYTGLYSIIAAKRGATVYAFEPNPAAHLRLKQNCYANGVTTGVLISSSAVCNDTGWATLHFPNANTLCSAASLIEPEDSKRGTRVNMTRLDDCIEGRVDAIKIDAEGAESAVLLGAYRLLCKYKPMIICECLKPEALQEVREILGLMGYFHEPLSRREYLFHSA